MSPIQRTVTRTFIEIKENMKKLMSYPVKCINGKPKFQFKFLKVTTSYSIFTKTPLSKILPFFLSLFILQERK